VGWPDFNVAARILRISLLTPFGSSSPSSSLSWEYVSRLSSCWCAYGISVAMQRVEVELTKAVTPYALSMGLIVLACRRPRVLIGRVASLRDQSLRSIALTCRTMISGVVAG